MKGLFIKDWRLMSRQMKLMLVFVLVFVGMFSYTMEDSLALTGFYTVIFLMLSVNCFAYDETCHFDKLAAAAPIPKSRVVLTRYLAALAVGAVGMVTIAAVHGGIQLFQGKPSADILGDLLVIAACSFAGIVFISILFPIFYKFGVNKSRLIMILAFAIPSAAGGRRHGAPGGVGCHPALLPGFSALPSLPADRHCVAGTLAVRFHLHPHSGKQGILIYATSKNAGDSRRDSCRLLRRYLVPLPVSGRPYRKQPETKPPASPPHLIRPDPVGQVILSTLSEYR